jgi:hypothetical protein
VASPGIGQSELALVKTVTSAAAVVKEREYEGVDPTPSRNTGVLFGTTSAARFAARWCTGGRLSLFRHPHLIRGIVHTPDGQFVIRRGLVEMPDDAGERLGWVRIESSDKDREPDSPQPTAFTNR